MSYEGYFRHRNILAGHYEYHLPAHLRNVLPGDRGARILDIGCGFGQMLRALREIGYGNAEGVDASPEAVELCQGSRLAVRRIEDLERFCGERPEPGYELVIMSHVLEHIKKERIIPTLKAIRERLLAPGGAFLAMFPNAQSNTGCYWAYEDFTHETLITAGSLLFVLKAAGFCDVRFLDPEGLEGGRLLFRLPKKLLLRYYKAKIHFWNLVTNSAFHAPSPQIFTFELKTLAR